MEAFLALEHAGWKGVNGTSMLSRPDHAGFFRDACHGLAERDRVHLLELRAGSLLVAAACNVIAGDTLFAFKTAYDEELARFAPGIQLAMRTAEAFHAMEELERLDSCCPPGSTWLDRLWSDRIGVVGLAVPGNGAVGRAASWALPRLVPLRDRVRQRRAAARAAASAA